MKSETVNLFKKIITVSVLVSTFYSLQFKSIQCLSLYINQALSAAFLLVCFLFSKYLSLAALEVEVYKLLAFPSIELVVRSKC